MKINRLIFVLLVVLLITVIIVVFQIGQPTGTPTPVLKTYINANLRRLVMEAMMYMNDHNVKIVTYANLTKNETYLDSNPLKSYLGEDYSRFNITDTDTSVEVVTREGEIVSYAFPAWISQETSPVDTEP